MKSLMVPFPFKNITGRVLDVGSGNNPVNIATHLLDLHPEDNTERGGQLELPAGIEEFKEGSIENIPYPEKYFDFVHASHVIEHVDHPEQAIAEVMRTGRTAYLETPASMIEYERFGADNYPGWHFHKWFVWSFPGRCKLYFKPKTEQNLAQYCDCEFGKIAEKMIRKNQIRRAEAYLPYFCKMNQFIWRGQPKIEVEVWSEKQVGSPTDSLPCNCGFLAFFIHTRQYFRSPKHLYRLFRFWRDEREIFAIFKQTHQLI
jgi:hypothetical protein